MSAVINVNANSVQDRTGISYPRRMLTNRGSEDTSELSLAATRRQSNGDVGSAPPSELEVKPPLKLFGISADC